MVTQMELEDAPSGTLAGCGIASAFERQWRCGKGLSASSPAGVAVVTGAGRAYFHGDAAICPNRQAYCLKRAYVIAADHVLTGGSQGGYTCVFAPSKSTTTSGWIETNRLRPEAINSSPPSSAWEGAWESEGVMRINVTRDKSGLRASGLDDWDSGDGTDARGKIALPGRNHHAEFSGRLSAVGDHARLKGGDCAADLTLMGAFLIVVEDDNSCGDGNTSFRGIYRRKP
jgi:hypothetical protein